VRSGAVRRESKDDMMWMSMTSASKAHLAHIGISGIESIMSCKHCQVPLLIHKERKSIVKYIIHLHTIPPCGHMFSLKRHLMLKFITVIREVLILFRLRIPIPDLR
jgi:hypothetical protein